MQEFLTFIDHHQLIVGAILVLLCLLTVIEFARARRLAVQITPQQAVKMINHDNAVVIDTRNKELYKDGHIIDAVSIDASEMINPSKKIEKYRSKPLILVGHTTGETQKIAALLQKQGYTVYSLAGGLRGWTDAQLPLIKE